MMIATKCNISFTIGYTSPLPITVATANYKISGTSTLLLNPPLNILPNIGSLITLPDISIAEDYDLIVTLTNSSGTVTQTTPFKIGNCSGNTPPVAEAGSDSLVSTSQITLDGSGSHDDSSGSIVTYLWTQTDGPSATITNSNQSITTATLTSDGIYKFELTVTDNNGATDTDAVEITLTKLIKAKVDGVSISPLFPDAQDTITVTASVYNPNLISNLEYEWYLDDTFLETTYNTDYISFGDFSVSNAALTLGEHTVKVGLVGSLNNNHTTDQESITFQVGIFGNRCPPGFTEFQTGTNCIESISNDGTTKCYQCNSFLAGTLVRMSDGTLQKVENIKLGDELIGSEGNVKVINVLIYKSDAKKYRLNDETYFVTETHPIMTDKGWKSFDPEKTKLIVPAIEVSLLQKGDILIKEDGKQEVLDNTDFITGSHLVYNFGVDNTNDFYANGYLVHNKTAPITTPNGDPMP
jgi:hypothetical protein